MTGSTSCEAQARPEGSAPSDKAAKKTVRFIASTELPSSISVYITRRCGDHFTLFTTDRWIGDWDFADSWVTLPDLYRHVRRELKKPITFHVPTVDMALDLVDELPNEIKYGRLAVALCSESLPLPPPNPDQHLIDFMDALEVDFESALTAFVSGQGRQAKLAHDVGATVCHDE